CLIARDEARGQAPVHGLSLVFDTFPELARERKYLDIALAGQAGIVSHRFAGDALMQFAPFADPPPHDERCPAPGSLAPAEAMTAGAARVGATTVLTGLGADELFDVPPYHLTDLLRRGRLLAAWAEAGRWARADNQGLWQVLWPFGLANVLPAWLHSGA